MNGYMPQGYGTRTGLQISISDWLERGRNLNTDALRLNSVQQAAGLAATEPSRAAFLGWHQAWQPFYDKYIGPNASTLAQSNVSVNYDEFNRDLYQRKSQFDAIGAQYNADPSSQVQKYTPSNDNVPSTGMANLPWWGYLLGGVALAGVGVAITHALDKRTVASARARRTTTRR